MDQYAVIMLEMSGVQNSDYDMLQYIAMGYGCHSINHAIQ